MQQPSQLKDSLPLLGFNILLSAIYIPIALWSLRKKISNMQKSPDFTDQDIIAIRHQMLALLVEVPLVLLFFALSRLILAQPSPSLFLFGLIIGFAPLAYVAINSIKNRIALGGRTLPAKGTKAVWSGVLGLVFIISMFFAGLVIYFTSLK